MKPIILHTMQKNDKLSMDKFKKKSVQVLENGVRVQRISSDHPGVHNAYRNGFRVEMGPGKTVEVFGLESDIKGLEHALRRNPERVLRSLHATGKSAAYYLNIPAPTKQMFTINEINPTVAKRHVAANKLYPSMAGKDQPLTREEELQQAVAESKVDAPEEPRQSYIDGV